MKFFKVIIVALITVFAFGSAEAQRVVRTTYHPRKVVVVKKHTHHRYHKHRPPVRHHY